MKGADLAEAANIPLGSVHSVLQSLEKKKRIVSTRPGVFQIL
jgi:sugar-specific transcriptional regulator TrmB